MYIIINELTGAVISRHRSIKNAEKGQIRYEVRTRRADRLAGIPLKVWLPTSIRHADGTKITREETLADAAKYRRAKAAKLIPSL
jgi:hypothetical protein